MRTPAIDRFMAKVEFSQTGECWFWTAYCKPNGYPQFMEGHRITKYAHRWSYEFYKGAIPEGMVLDHLCRNKSCVNPNHLEAVTQSENLRRGIGTAAQVAAARTHCPSGHPYDEVNTYWLPGSKRHRMCRECRRTRNRLAQRELRYKRNRSASI